MNAARAPLTDIKVHVKLKMAALWTSVMFCYIYADYFGLYVPGKLDGMLAGQIAPLGPATQGVLIGTSAMLAIPSVMIFLSVALSPPVNRWVNVIAGVLYTIIILVTMWDWPYAIFYGVIEIILTTLVVWYAWTWPREAVGALAATGETSRPGRSGD